MSLHKRIAQVLGWTVEDTRRFSLHSLRELVRPVDPRLAADITSTIQSGSYIFQG